MLDPLARLRVDVATEGVGAVHLLASEARGIIGAYDALVKAAREYAEAQRRTMECHPGDEDAIAESDAELHVARVHLYALLPRLTDRPAGETQ